MRAIEPKSRPGRRRSLIREVWRNFSMMISLSVDAQLEGSGGWRIIIPEALE
jgi:hypothetical protein